MYVIFLIYPESCFPILKIHSKHKLTFLTTLPVQGQVKNIKFNVILYQIIFYLQINYVGLNTFKLKEFELLY